MPIPFRPLDQSKKKNCFPPADWGEPGEPFSHCFATATAIQTSFQGGIDVTVVAFSTQEAFGSGTCLRADRGDPGKCWLYMLTSLAKGALASSQAGQATI